MTHDPDDELNREIQTHLDLETEERIADGLSEDEARAAARRAFGNVTRTKEDVRAVWAWTRLDQLLQDVRYAVRTVRRSPGFALVAIMTLALGIGANTALFSVADPLLTRPLPVQRPDELVLFRTIGSPAWADAQALVPYALSERIRSGSAAFNDAVVVEHQTLARRKRIKEDSKRLGEIVWTSPVSGSFFQALGVTPTLGRAFTSADDRAGAAPVLVISHEFWRRRYASDPGVIGRQLSLEEASMAGIMTDAVTATIVGVAPRGFHGVDLDAAPDIWLPITVVRQGPLFAQGPKIGIIRTMARLRPGVSIKQAQAEIDAMSADAFKMLSGQYARVAAARPRILVEPGATGYSTVRGRLQGPLVILMPAVGFVLLLACANLASLLLTRAAARHKEIAIRLSIGSGRSAIVRLLLAESFVLTAAGAALALLMFRWVRVAASAYLPAESGVLPMIALDARLLLFTCVLSLLSILLFGLAPAVWISKLDINRLIREPHSQSHLSASVRRLHNLIVPVQVALALLLLVGAGLFLTTLRNLRGVSTGFDQRQVLQITLDARADRTNPRTLSLPAELFDRLDAVPGVRSSTFYMRYGLLQSTSQITIGDETGARNAEEVSSLRVGPRFFETTGIALVAGRTFDMSGSPRAIIERSEAVISASLAKHLFGGIEAAVGRSVTPASSRSLRVIGVAEDASQVSLREAAEWAIFEPLALASAVTTKIALRTDGDASRIAPSVRAAVRDFSPEFQVTEVLTFRDIMEASISIESLLARVSSVFGVLALFLAALGVYGVIAYAVARRTTEIGVRMALGATRVEIGRLVVGQVTALGVVGLIAGALIAWQLSSMVTSYLFGVYPTDLGILALAVGVLVLAALAAAAVPTLRAASVDPAFALREE